MSDDFDEFIQLHRTFHDLALSEEEGRESELFRLMRRDKPTQWSDLLEEPRVVLLSEAGSRLRPFDRLLEGLDVGDALGA